MSQFTVNLIEDRGPQLVDPISKSVWSKVAAFCVDLDRCGNPTHLKFQHDLSFNSRPLCAPPQTALQFSLSGLASLAVSGPENFTTLFFDSLIEILNFALLNGTVTAANVNVAIATYIDSVFGAGSVTPFVENRAKSFVQDTTGIVSEPNKFILQIARPSVYVRLDNCGVEVGQVANISGSLSILDTATCRPVIYQQLSVSSYLAYEHFYAGGVPTYVDESIQTAAATIGLAGGGYLNSIVAPWDCETISDQAFALLPSASPLVLGVA